VSTRGVEAVPESQNTLESLLSLTCSQYARRWERAPGRYWRRD